MVVTASQGNFGIVLRLGIAVRRHCPNRAGLGHSLPPAPFSSLRVAKASAATLLRKASPTTLHALPIAGRRICDVAGQYGAMTYLDEVRCAECRKPFGKAPFNIGIAEVGKNSPRHWTSPDCRFLRSGAHPGHWPRRFSSTDPGRTLITGKCAEIAKVKGPILPVLAARAPYFHNGSAATLSDVVEFYYQRSDIGFTGQQKEDLAAFPSLL